MVGEIKCRLATNIIFTAVIVSLLTIKYRISRLWPRHFISTTKINYRGISIFDRAPNRNAKKQLYCSRSEASCFHCEMLALHISLICSITLSFDQVHIKNNQPQDLSPNSHPTIDTIHQTQNAVKVLWVRVGMQLDQRRIEVHENSLEPWCYNTKSHYMNENKSHKLLTNIYQTDHIQYGQLTLWAPQFAEDPFGLWGSRIKSKF